MKKLLALVLCVMLFVSIIPTSAFAYNSSSANSKYIGDAETLADGWYPVATNKDAIDDLKDAMEDMFLALATNQTVFGTAKTLHDMANGLADSLFAGVDSIELNGFKEVEHDDLVANTRGYLKSIIGDYVTDYVNDRQAAWLELDDAGNPEGIDYENYLKIYAKGVEKSLTSAKAQKGIEALIYSLAALKLADSVEDEFDDLKDAMIDWNDYGSKWAEFGWPLYGDAAASAFADLWAFNGQNSKTPVLVPEYLGLDADDISTLADVIGAESAAAAGGAAGGAAAAAGNSSIAWSSLS